MKALFRLFSIVFFSQVLSSELGFSAPEEKVRLTVFLRHDQTKNLFEIQERQKANGFFEKFPPAGTAVVDWVVAMGIGQIVILDAPAAKVSDVEATLREVTRDAFSYEVFRSEDRLPELKGKLKNRTERDLAVSPLQPGQFLLSVVLEPNAGVSEKEVAGIAASQKLYENFPAQMSEIVSWARLADRKEVVILALPAEALRPTNVSLERHGWKAFKTAFHPSYDFYPIARDALKLKNLERSRRSPPK